LHPLFATVLNVGNAYAAERHTEREAAYEVHRQPSPKTAAATAALVRFSGITVSLI
jgi:hypothetical protein